MKPLSLISASISLFYAFSVVQATKETHKHLALLLSDPKYKPNTLGNVIPGRYIIEFDQDYHGSSLDFVNDVETQITQTDPAMNSRFKMSIAHDFTSESAIFRGISVSLSEMNSSRKRQTNEIHMQTYQNVVLRKILQHNRVKNIYPVTEIQRPKVEQLFSSNVYAFDKEKNIIPKAPDVKLSKEGPSLPFTHGMTQVNRVTDDLKFKGSGVLVGIIDSGIDYRHPAFGGGFGPGYTVRYGYDLVGNKFNSKDIYSRIQRDTPLDDCEEGNGHGTHVAGIIAANDGLFNFTGVAPEVTLGAWRVFGCDGATSNDLVIKALISAHEAGCDVINLSLGSSSNWAEDPTAIVANRISDKGGIVIAAAGNDGSEGAFYISSPGTGVNNIAVASIDNLYNLQKTAVTEAGEEYAYLLSSTTKSIPSGILINYTNKHVEGDACNDTKPENNIKGKLVLVQRGKCTFDEKAIVAQKHGALGIVVYDNQEEAVFKSQALKAKIPLSTIAMNSGHALKDAINTEKYKDGIPIEFKTALTPQKVSTGNTMSKFSSVGPLYDMSLKPDFAGPGGYIFSTLPIANGGYGMLSGTSMAAPYIAGAYALYIQAHGKEKGTIYLKEHFQNYAKPVNQGSHIDTPIRQGAGLIKLYDTINQSIHVSPGHISFNDTVNIAPKMLTISNPSNNTVTYHIKHKPALTVAPYNTTSMGFSPLQPPHYASHRVQAILKFSDDYLTVGPGESKELNMEVFNVTGLERAEAYPIYGGYVEFAPVNQTKIKSIHVPYIGISGSLAELPIFEEDFPQFMVGNHTKVFEQTFQDGHKKMGFIIDRTNQTSAHVTSMFRLLTGSPHIKTEVLDKNLSTLGLFSQERYLSRNTFSDSDLIFTQRWNGTMIPTGTENLGDLISVKPGFYHLKYKALKLLSDPDTDESWETVLSPLILVRD